ncbi:uncharacterized protein EV422DRAFT_505295 [Fimicolochytrium jonesii]|uniref:uncharacterized protein n=1 Tax=Fimicolochytrium jonesii TaxID=1396493 RepID=UPI0022FE9103|nr:uncharacterized protein EV422DRAFT_505295 [Fimicolochytrium jonesii]KAI8822465.1 hypothetical protein EV422DRAFT_505295 [Fimicolochytrium jonesii]
MSPQPGQHTGLFNNPDDASCVLRVIDTSRRPIAVAFSAPGPTDQYYWIHEWIVTAVSAVLEEAFDWRTNHTRRECTNCDDGNEGCHARHHRADGIRENERTRRTTKRPHGDSRTYFPMQKAFNGILYQWHGIRPAENAKDQPVITEYPHDIKCARERPSTKSRKDEPSAEPQSARVMSIATITSPTPTPTSTPAPASTRAARDSLFRVATHNASNSRAARRSSVDTPEPAPITPSCVPLLTICLPQTSACPETLYWMYSRDDERFRKALLRIEGQSATSRDGIGTGECRSMMEMFYWLGIEEDVDGIDSSRHLENADVIRAPKPVPSASKQMEHWPARSSQQNSIRRSTHSHTILSSAGYDMACAKDTAGMMNQQHSSDKDAGVAILGGTNANAIAIAPNAALEVHEDTVSSTRTISHTEGIFAHW